jgi:hypothetical protein
VIRIRIPELDGIPPERGRGILQAALDDSEVRRASGRQAAGSALGVFVGLIVVGLGGVGLAKGWPTVPLAVGVLAGLGLAGAYLSLWNTRQSRRIERMVRSLVAQHLAAESAAPEPSVGSNGQGYSPE